MVKERPSKDGEHVARQAGGHQKKRRLGGGGLSLAAFVAAKSKPKIAPSQIRQQREFYKNAKRVKEYKKLVGEISRKKDESEKPELADDDSPEGGLPPTRPGSRTEVHRGREKYGKGGGKKERTPTQLEKLQKEFDRKKIEAENAEKERRDAHKARKQTLDKAEQVRKDLQSKMRKKTRSGQPIMKYRVEHLLDSIQRSL